MHWVIGKYEKCTGRPLCVRYCPRGWINIRKLGNSTCLLSCLVPLEYVWKWKSLSPVLLFATPWTDLPGSSVHEILQARILEQVSHSLFQGIFPTQGLNPGLPHCRWILYHLSHRQQLWWLSKEVKSQFRVVIMLDFLVAQMVKNLPANIRDPGSIPWDSLEKGMVTPGFSPGEIPWSEESDRVQSMGSQRVGHNWATNTHITLWRLAREASLIIWHVSRDTIMLFLQMKTASKR